MNSCNYVCVHTEKQTHKHTTQDCVPAPPQYHIDVCHTNLNHYGCVVQLDFSANSIAFLPPPKIPESLSRDPQDWGAQDFILHG